MADWSCFIHDAKANIFPSKHAGLQHPERPLDEKTLEREAIAWYEAAIGFWSGKYLEEDEDIEATGKK